MSDLWTNFEYGDNVSYPRKSVIVIRTVEADGAQKYRVGMVTATDFKEGIRLGSNPLALNPSVATRCFGKSRVYDDQGSALKEADRVLNACSRLSVGIKVFQFNGPFPASY